MASPFPVAPGSLSDGLNMVAASAVATANASGVGTGIAVAQTANSQTLTAAQVLLGVLRFTAGNVAATTTLVFPTAALLVAAVAGCQVGTKLLVFIQNGCGQTLTLTAGTGGTVTGTAAVATATSQLVIIEFTNVTAGSEAIAIVPFLKTAS